MQITLGAAMMADAQAGGACATGVDQLEAAVASSCEKMMLDADTAVNEKMVHFLPDFEQFTSSEPLLSFGDAEGILAVTQHATYGRMNALILTSCSCNPGGPSGIAATNKAANPNQSQTSCVLHAETVQLSDLVYEITSVIHQVFTDQFMCFAQLLRERCVAGWDLDNH